MKFSIITVCKNMGEELRATISSIKNQSYRDFEYIIIDGDSTDSTKKVIKLNKDVVNKLVSEADSGIYEAMNKGLKLARGEYVYFLNAGDTLASDSVLKEMAKKAQNFDLIYGDVNVVDSKQSYRNYFTRVDSWFLVKNSICHQAMFSKRELYLKWGIFDENFQVAGDYEWLLRVWSKINTTKLYLPIVVANFNMGGKSSSQKYRQIAESEGKIIRKKYFNFWYRGAYGILKWIVFCRKLI